MRTDLDAVDCLRRQIDQHRATIVLDHMDAVGIYSRLVQLELKASRIAPQPPASPSQEGFVVGVNCGHSPNEWTPCAIPSSDPFADDPPTPSFQEGGATPREAIEAALDHDGGKGK